MYLLNIHNFILTKSDLDISFFMYQVKKEFFYLFSVILLPDKMKIKHLANGRYKNNE